MDSKNSNSERQMMYENPCSIALHKLQFPALQDADFELSCDDFCKKFSDKMVEKGLVSSIQCDEIDEKICREFYEENIQAIALSKPNESTKKKVKTKSVDKREVFFF